jgi:hypothetical protein
MNHLTAEALNMYLDDAIGPHERAAADAHLASCAACRGELAALHRLFAAIEELPPDPLPADLTAQVLGRIARAPEPRTTQRVSAWEPRQATGDKRQNPQPALAMAILIVQIALTVALAIWLTPQLVGVVLARLGALRLPTPSDLMSALIELSGQLASAGAAPSELSRIGGALSAGPLGAFSAVQWAMILAGVGIVWFFGNRFLLAGSPERRGNHQEAA